MHLTSTQVLEESCHAGNKLFYRLNNRLCVIATALLPVLTRW